MQNVWGEENVPEKVLSRKVLDPSKRASVLLCLGVLYRKNRALTPEGWKTYHTKGGPKPLFGGGVIREVFLPPLFSTPPWRPLRISDSRESPDSRESCESIRANHATKEATLSFFSLVFFGENQRKRQKYQGFSALSQEPTSEPEPWEQIVQEPELEPCRSPQTALKTLASLTYSFVRILSSENVLSLT